jgi:hypothetical protein
VLASYLRPSLLLVSFPERRHGIPTHNFRSPRIQSGFAHSIQPSAWRNGTASGTEFKPQEFVVDRFSSDTPVDDQFIPRVRFGRERCSQ